LVDTRGLKPRAVRRGGSNPPAPIRSNLMEKVFCLVKGAPGYGPRIFVYENHLAEARIILDGLSYWGSYDKRWEYEKMLGWEFPSQHLASATILLKRSGFQEVPVKEMIGD
jgi:hypothetical protein